MTQRLFRQKNQFRKRQIREEARLACVSQRDAPGERGLPDAGAAQAAGVGHQLAG